MLNSTRQRTARLHTNFWRLTLQSLEDRLTPVAPVISSLMPMDNQGDVDVTSTLVVQFDRSVEIGSGNITLREIATDAVIEQIAVTSAQVSINDDTLTIDPSADLPSATPIYVSIDAGAVRSLTTTQQVGENFDGLTLGPATSEEGTGTGDNMDFTLSAPIGWDRTFSGEDGVTEFNGWSFVDQNFWQGVTFFNNTPGGDSTRAEFQLAGSSPFAVADAASWGWTSANQGANPPGSQPPGDHFDTTLTTPNISLNNAEEGSVELSFDSSWVIDSDGTQTVSIQVAYDDGMAQEVLLWSSDPGDANFKPSNTNETVTIGLNNPAGVSTAKLSFRFSADDDDRWWALDNLSLSAAVPAGAGNGDPFAGLTELGDWNFSTTGVSGDAPEIVSIIPMSDANDVPVDTDIQIVFDKPIQAGVDGYLDVRLVSDNPLLDNTVVERVTVTSDRVDINGATVTVSLSTPLAMDTEYALIMSEGAFVDQSGNFTEGVPLLIEDFEGVEPFLQNSPLANDSIEVPADLDDYVLVATGELQVLPGQGGTYTLGLTSDDGARLRIDFGNGFEDVIVADVLRGIGAVDLSAAVMLQEGGRYPFEYLLFERGGNSGGELMYAPGEPTGFDDTFRVIGDPSQGLAVTQFITATTYKSLDTPITSLSLADDLVNGTVAQETGYPVSAKVVAVDFNNTGSAGRFGVNLPVPIPAPIVGPNRDFSSLEDAQMSGGQLIGWNGSFSPEGGAEEFFGWTILDKQWWINQQDDQNRSLWTGGINNLLVADSDAYSDTTDIQPDSGEFLLVTPEIPTTNIVSDLELNFNSTFLPSDAMRATIEVRFDGGAWELVDEYTTANSGGASSLNRIDETVSYTVALPAATDTAEFRFGLVDFDFDGWWALDNLEVRGSGLVGNPSAGITDPTALRFRTRDLTPPSVVSFAPADNTLNVDPDTDLTITFDEPVLKGTGNIEIRNFLTNALIESIAIGSNRVQVDGNQVSIDRTVTISDRTVFYVLINEGALTDANGRANPFGISDPDTWTLLTAGAATDAVYRQNSLILENGTSTGAVYNGTQDADPTNAGVVIDDYVVVATGTLQVSQDGAFTFGVNTDDGNRLRIDINQNGTFEDNEILIAKPNPQGTTTDLSVVQNLTAGNYDFEFLFWERGGGSSGEFFYAPGDKGSFDNDFRLIGDDSQGIGVNGDIDVMMYKAAPGTQIRNTDQALDLVANGPLAPGFPVSATLAVLDLYNSGGTGEFSVDLPVPGATGENSVRNGLSVAVDSEVEGGASHGLTQLNDLIGEATGQIPADASIVAATLTLDVFDAGDPVNVHRMLQPWEESSITWNALGTAPFNNEPGIQGDDVDATAPLRLLPGSLGQQQIDVTDDLRAWFAGEPNYGWGFTPTGPDDVRWESSENPLALGRPKLNVIYTLITPPPTMGIVYQQGVEIRVDGTGIGLAYAATQDADPTSASVDVEDYAFVARGTLQVDQSGDYTFGVNSDDGNRLRVDLNQNGAFEADEILIITPGVQSPTITLAGVQTLAAGQYAFEFLYFERSGGSSGEFFYAPGEKSDFDADFRLIGDASQGIGIQGIIQANTFKAASGTELSNLDDALDLLVNGPLAPGFPVTANLSVLDVLNSGPSGAFDVDLQVPGLTREAETRDRNELAIDGSVAGGATHGLLQFGNLFGDAAGQIPFGATIVTANLSLTVIGPGSVVNVHRMLEPWEQASISWERLGQAPFNTTGGIQGDGTEATEVLQTFPAPLGVQTLDVTQDLQVWSNGQPNYGWGFTPTGGNNVVWLSSENNIITGRPQLNVVFSIAGTPSTFQVINTTITNTGVEFAFNRTVDLDRLNLYEDGNLGSPDLVLVGPNDQPVVGSLVPDAEGRNFTFVASGGLLAPGDYTLTLVSDINGFVDIDGNLLDGNGNGMQGDNFTTSFTIAESTAVSVTLPNFARGPGQTANIPNTQIGLPLRLSDATDVREVILEITYDPSLLSISAASVATGLPAGANVTLDNNTPGRAILAFLSPEALTGTNLAFVRLTATVPDTAALGLSHVLRVQNVRINQGAMQGQGDAAVHNSAYFGDVTNGGVLNVEDVTESLQLAAGQDSGFRALPLIDPRLVADIDGDSRITVSDVTLLLQAAAGQVVPQIPLIP